jgi:hypothetical protein
MANCSSGETSVCMYKLEEAMEGCRTPMEVCLCFSGYGNMEVLLSPKGDEITTRGYRVQTSIECKLS